MILLKQGVRMGNLCPQIVLALTICDGIYVAHDAGGMWVTSLNDGIHGERSFHYSGRACDLRTHSIREAAKPEILAAIRGALGSDFQVFHESKGTPNEHFHIEYQPMI